MLYKMQRMLKHHHHQLNNNNNKQAKKKSQLRRTTYEPSLTFTPSFNHKMPFNFGVMKSVIRGVPVETYPLIAAVTLACSMGKFIQFILHCSANFSPSSSSTGIGTAVFHARRMFADAHGLPPLGGHTFLDTHKLVSAPKY
jgi:hypothetical protein